MTPADRLEAWKRAAQKNAPDMKTPSLDRLIERMRRIENSKRKQGPKP